MFMVGVLAVLVIILVITITMKTIVKTLQMKQWDNIDHEKHT